MRRSARTVLAAGATLACTIMLGTGVASASGGWVIQSTYAPPAAKGAQKDIHLQEVSCAAANACVTIGIVGSKKLLSESWNGTKWTPLLTRWPSQGGELNGVSCTAASACTAVGSTSNASLQPVPLVERWNGTGWQPQVVSGQPGAGFIDVSCPAAQFCMAIGADDTGAHTTATLAEAWNGTSWTVLPTPPEGRHAALFSVSCPTSSDCVAVGENVTVPSSTVFIERWNGTSWAIQKSPQVPAKDAPQLDSVSCATASSCTAMGNYFTDNRTQLLVEHWTGTSWARQHVPGAAAVDLFQVSCGSATSCTAVGANITGHWNGTAWALQRPAVPPHAIGHGVTLYDLSCPTASACEAVGFFHAPSKTTGFTDRTVIEAN